jgi:alcohol dehydrogenase class IV
MTLIAYLTRTHFADGAIEDALPEEAHGVGAALLIADASPGTAEALDRVRDALPRTALAVRDASPDVPRLANVGRVLDSAGHGDPGAIVAVGGAGAIGEARLAVEFLSRRGAQPMLIAVPVGLFDLGLPREVRPRDGEPLGCGRPDSIILDPSVLALSDHRRLAAAGMEVLVHAMEAYASPAYNPQADALAMDAVRRLSLWLPRLAQPAHAIEVRRELMAGALSAGLASEKSAGGVDALAHRLEDELAGAVLPGELHAPVLAALIGFNAQAVGERYAALADAVGRGSEPRSLEARLVALARILGLPSSLRETTANRDSFASVAKTAADDPAALANPRRLTPSDCRGILEAAW